LTARSLPPEAREALSYAIALHRAPYDTQIVMDSETNPLHTRVQIAPLRDAAGLAVGKTICLTEHSTLRDCQDQLKQANRARAALEARLNNTWGPALALGNGVLVIPVTGILDPPRTEHLVTGLMNTVRTQQARIVLIDLHAIRTISVQSAASLIQGTEAVALLGTQIGWVGIQPQVAQVIGDLGVSIDQLHVHPDLPAALAYYAVC
jgi:anti-anti-sigma regulatory factor